MSLPVLSRLISSLVSLAVVCSVAWAGEAYVTKKKLSRHDVEPYLEAIIGKAGDNLLKVHRVVSTEEEATVFFRYHSRYGHTTDHQFTFVRDEKTGRWLDKERDTFLTVTEKPGTATQ